MLAQWTDKVVRQHLAFVDVAADLADPALLAFGLWLWLYILLVVGVGHGCPVGCDTCLCYRADEHDVGFQVHLVLHLEGEHCVDVLGEERQAIVRLCCLNALELVHCTSALEAEPLEDVEGCVHREAVYVECLALLDHVAGVVPLVDADCNLVVAYL